MERKQQIFCVLCGALAGFTGSIVVAFWAGEPLYSLSIFSFYELLIGLMTTAPLGIIVGFLMGLSIVLRKPKQVWQIRYWTGKGIQWGVLAITPWFFLYFLLWIGTLMGISSAGESSEAVFGLSLVLIVGVLSGMTGGTVGGFIFSKYSGQL